jgi:hypothetical protein
VGLLGSEDQQDGRQKRLRESGNDAVQLVLDYVKQETLQPLKGVGRFLVFGAAGSLALCAGVVLLLIALLRVLQSETGSAMSGHLSWLPYVIVGGVALLVMGLGAWMVTRGPAARRRPPRKEGGS